LITIAVLVPLQPALRAAIAAAPLTAQPGQEGPTVMLTTAERRTASSSSPPSRPRLRLQPDLSARAPLDGGWWPRSADPAAELPGLILAIEGRHGPITKVMLGKGDWDGVRPRRLRVDGPAGSRVVRLGWFETMPAGLLTATAMAGRTDLLTVPPRTAEPAARAAMEQAAQAGNRTGTPALLAATTTATIPARPPASTPAVTAPDNIQLSTWEWEGGHDSASSPEAGASAISQEE
jgi:Family of unknown function (DUF5994)